MPAADIYAVGVVLYEALAGHRPFRGDDPFQVAVAIREGRHAPLGEVRRGLPPDLVAAVERAMAVEPADRFDTADDFASAIAGAAHRPSTTTTVTIPPLDAIRILPSGIGSAKVTAAPIPSRPDRDSAMPLPAWLVILAIVLVFGAATVALVDATGSNSVPAHGPPAASPSPRPHVSSVSPTPQPAQTTDGGHGRGDGHGGDKPGKGPKDH